MFDLLALVFLVSGILKIEAKKFRISISPGLSWLVSLKRISERCLKAYL